VDGFILYCGCRRKRKRGFGNKFNHTKVALGAAICGLSKCGSGDASEEGERESEREREREREREGCQPNKCHCHLWQKGDDFEL